MFSLKTLFHTVRYLRPVQIYGRAWFKLYHPAVQLTPAPRIRALSSEWVIPARRQASLVRPWLFRFLNEEHVLTNIKDWDDPKIEKLWRYNLHYFEDLNAVEADSRRDWHKELLECWVRENPPATGTGWEPYPTSLRIVNWIKWALAGHELHPACLHSLAVQIRWLSRRLENHLLGNHLFTNAKALVFAGLFFDGPEAVRWLETGLRILKREVPEQILNDGGQFERSTMYHALALEDMLDLCNVTAAFPKAIPRKWSVMIDGWKELVDRMMHWLMVMCHPDGEVSFFNDTAIGIAPSPVELGQYAGRLGFLPVDQSGDGTIYLQDSGYIRVQTQDMVALLDVAPVGPDYLPGHAHADILSFELSLFGQRLVVNSGISQYGNDPERQRQRSTAAHNTVCIDGEDSSEIWAGFRVARRAYPSTPKFEQTQAVLVISCSHNGYERLPGRCIHTREWHFEDTFIAITDKITGEFGKAVANFHIHPEITVNAVPDSTGMFDLIMESGNKVAITIKGADNTELKTSTWHPEFGVSHSNVCIAATFSSHEISTYINW